MKRVNRMNRRCFRGRRGFTLIELMIATVVMTVGLFAILHLQVVVVRGNAYSRELSEASELADGVVEYLRIQALEWRTTAFKDNPPLTDVDYFKDFHIAPTPAQGVNFPDLVHLRALDELSINPDIHPVPIASSHNPADALPLTVAGLPSTLAPGKEGLRAIYRVHYLAYNSRVTADDVAAADDLVTILVIVSWDNKDHGRQEQSWDSWYSSDPDKFFERHMVVKRVLLQPVRTY